MAENGGGSVDFTTNWQFADICFEVDGRKLFANKMILSMWSPVFMAMFNRDFKVTSFISECYVIISQRSKMQQPTITQHVFVGGIAVCSARLTLESYHHNSREV